MSANLAGLLRLVDDSTERMEAAGRPVRRLSSGPAERVEGAATLRLRDLQQVFSSCWDKGASPCRGVDAGMASAIEATHRLPLAKQAVAIPWLYNGGGGDGDVLPETLGQVLGEVLNLGQGSPRLVRRQAGERIQ